MDAIVRFLALLPGLGLLGNGIGFLVDPATTARALGMPLLEGIGRSTQIGDFSAFFFGAFAMCVLGAWKRNGTWLFAGAILIGGAAIFRILATVLHDAPLATLFIPVELAIAGIWAGCGCYFNRARVVAPG
jgi:hypothetical protein